MAEIILRRTLAGLIPTDEAGQEALRRIKIGDHAKANITGLAPRNERRLRWWWKAVELVHNALSDKQLERWPTKESMADALKVALGHCDISHTAGGFTTPEGQHVPAGTLIVRPRSIAFAKLSEDEFGQICDRFCDLICTKVLPGVRSDNLRREIESIAGLRKEAA